MLNWVSGRNQISVHADSSGLDGPSALQALKVQSVLSEGGVIRITLLNSGEVINVPAPAHRMPAPDPGALDFVEKLCLIQQALGTPIRFPPDGSFTPKDVHAADELLSIIRTGRHEESGLIFTVELRKAGIAKLLAGLSEGAPVYLQLAADECYVDILTQRIQLGPTLQIIRGFWRKPFEEVRNWLATAQDDESLEIRLEDVELHEELEQWPKASL